MSLYQNLFYAEFINELCSDETMINFLMESELALAKAQEQESIIPNGMSDVLSGIFQNASIDFEKLKNDIPLSGNAAAPLVKQLVLEVMKEHKEAAKYIHLGATSQDIVDTATILKVKSFLNWLSKRIETLESALVKLTDEHRETVIIGRTLMQQARPITFGLKTAYWLEGIRSANRHIDNVRSQLLVIQLGGAVGSNNQYLTKNVKLSFAKNLGLGVGGNWHTQRTNVAAFASSLGVLTGNLSKIANDIVLLSQTEVGEVEEPSASGRGTSSTMPHKRNPVLSSSILANAHRIPFLVASILAAMPHTHERSAGKWHSEWETLDDIICLTGGAIENTIELIEGLEVNMDRMLQNIEHTKGLVFAETVALRLAEKMGKAAAHDLIKEACHKAIKEDIHLRDFLDKINLEIPNEELNKLFLPENSIGMSLDIIDEILSK